MKVLLWRKYTHAFLSTWAVFVKRRRSEVVHALVKGQKTGFHERVTKESTWRGYWKCPQEKSVRLGYFAKCISRSWKPSFWVCIRQILFLIPLALNLSDLDCPFQYTEEYQVCNRLHASLLVRKCNEYICTCFTFWWGDTRCRLLQGFAKVCNRPPWSKACLQRKYWQIYIYIWFNYTILPNQCS